MVTLYLGSLVNQYTYQDGSKVICRCGSVLTVFCPFVGFFISAGGNLNNLAIGMLQEHQGLLFHF